MRCRTGYELFADSLKKLDAEGVEIIPQTMAPFPWHFGGQPLPKSFCCNPEEIIYYGVMNSDLRMCFDISHSMLTCNYLKKDFYEIANKAKIEAPKVEMRRH